MKLKEIEKVLEKQGETIKELKKRIGFLEYEYFKKKQM